MLASCLLPVLIISYSAGLEVLVPPKRNTFTNDTIVPLNYKLKPPLG